VEEYVTIQEYLDSQYCSVGALGSIDDQVLQIELHIRYVIKLYRIASTLCSLRGRSPSTNDSEDGVTFPLSIVRDAVDYYNIYLGRGSNND
jgi:hypothetical protein